MTHLIDKDALVAEINRLIAELVEKGEDTIFEQGRISAFEDAKLFLDTFEVKDVEEYKQPEYSCLKAVYWCGKKPHWNIGDMLAYYEFDSDIEGECVLGKVINVELDEEQCDWLYTFEDGSVYDEQSLLEDQTYKKN